MSGVESRDRPAEFMSRKDFGEALTRRAQRLDLSQTAIARESKRRGELIRAGTLANWMVGNSVPSVNLTDQLRTLLRILQVPETEIGEWVQAARRIGETPKPGAAIDSPWPGLASFAPDQAEDFYGRDDVQQRLRAAVARAWEDTACGIVAVTGASGAGKTSLLTPCCAPDCHRASGSPPVRIRTERFGRRARSTKRAVNSWW
ncbi:ATP-binding protein [Antrihabitans spumae]|uniref:Novel STAND NTPase 1 domain-containing protein n=1 Tax=Antrihabitans spumae TaxID=3373370 RepID=A0ABW7KNT4_9NOCA